MIDSLPGSNGDDILVDLSGIDVPAGTGAQNKQYIFVIPAGRVFPDETLRIMTTYRSKVAGDIAAVSATINSDTAHVLNLGLQYPAEQGGGAVSIDLDNAPYVDGSIDVLSKIDAYQSCWITETNVEQSSDLVRVSANIAGAFPIQLDFQFSPGGGVIDAIRIVKV